MNPILILGDSSEDLDLKRELDARGHRVKLVALPELGEQKRSLFDYSIIVCHHFHREILALAPEVPVFVISTDPSVDLAVAAMKQGAVDYVLVPMAKDQLAGRVHAWLSEQETASPDRAPISGMLGSCPAMLRIFDEIAKVAPTDTTVLIEGESGTGKELVARALHERSDRSHREMISLNCAAIPDTLIESELFGHERGAFTGATNSRIGLVEAADGSTLFLDEIGELPADAQARLLRVLQEGEVRKVGSIQTRKVNVRLIAATHRKLKALMEQHRFREDLYYRLNVMALRLPPLRDRELDILPLADSFLRRFCATHRKVTLTLTPDAKDLIQRYSWPGNIRELENAIERAVILCEQDEIGPHLLAIDPTTGPRQPVAEPPEPPTEVNGDRSELSLEDYFLRFVLENQDHMTEKEIADKLGISRQNLWTRRKKLNIPRITSRQRPP